ncbi:MAG: membrane protein YqaA with SNARE-associated domain [Desulforhopalus sp.]|jgi:membrane protein YqaA with SNARE-associated domain
MEFFSSLANAPSLPLLFVISFLAATVVPLGSEWLLVLMIVQGFSVGETVIAASLGNYLGSCTTYMIGQYGSTFIISKLLRIDTAQLIRAKKLYAKYGKWSLLVSWLPIIGDPICLVAGIFKVNWLRFSTLVFIGKFCRYATVAYFAHKAIIV